MRESSELTAIDLFCGAGGLSLGLSRAGFKIALAVDNDPLSLATYSRNLAHSNLRANLSTLNPRKAFRNADRPSRIDLIAGGPPCQGFSLQRRGNDQDDRNILLLRFLDWVEEFNPTFFLIENVAGLQGHRGRPYLERLLNRASILGYDCSVQLINAADYGLPQIRKRMFIVGEFRSKSSSTFRFPAPTHVPKTYRTAKDAIGDLPPLPSDGSEHPDWPNHRADRLSAKNRMRFSFVPPGGGRADIPAAHRLTCHKNSPDQTGHRYVYGRLAWDKPASTITARFDSLTRGRFGHPSQARSISLREGARFQTFPDSFVFIGNKVEVARQIGNAVPPDLAFIAGSAIRRAWSQKMAAASPNTNRPARKRVLTGA